MNNLKLDPFKDMPTCDICGGVTASLVTERDGGNCKIISRITFACGASWVTSTRALFDSRQAFPNGELAPYDSRFGAWTEVDECGNAVEVIRQQRTACKEGPDHG